MRDYHGKLKHVKYLGIVTGEEFEKAYEEMSASPDKLPTASHLLPMPAELGREVGNHRVQAWIYYETVFDPVPELTKKAQEDDEMNLEL